MLPDFSQRTDALEDFAEKKLHQKPFGSENESEIANSGAASAAQSSPGNMPAGTTQPYSTQPYSTQPYSTQPYSTQPSTAVRTAPSNQADYPHVTSLEKSILSQTFVGQDLLSRLNRLETTAFGQPSTNPDMSQRTDALDKYVVKKLHKKPFAEQQAQNAETASAPNANGQQQTAQGSSGTSKALGMVANTLLGVAGLKGPMGMMGPGMGMGHGMPRVGLGGGPRTGQRQQQQQAAASEKDDDPEVFTSMPPPREARLLTKIGWCEVKTFGHTFQSMHLTDRLRQLSKQLDFETTKSDLELMDDIGGMIKVVQAHQPSTGATPIGAAPQQAVH
jgi:hypothetical protein